MLSFFDVEKKSQEKKGNPDISGQTVRGETYSTTQQLFFHFIWLKMRLADLRMLMWLVFKQIHRDLSIHLKAFISTCLV